MFSSLNSLRLVFIAFWVGLAVECHGQTTQTIEVYYEEDDWKTAALAQNKKQKDADGNKLNVYVPIPSFPFTNLFFKIKSIKTKLRLSARGKRFTHLNS